MDELMTVRLAAAQGGEQHSGTGLPRIVGNLGNVRVEIARDRGMVERRDEFEDVRSIKRGHEGAMDGEDGPPGHLVGGVFQPADLRRVLLRADGKVMKSARYTPPDVAGVLRDQEGGA